jgi:uncharacterized membrane protein YhaH (DUF805 family)
MSAPIISLQVALIDLNAVYANPALPYHFTAVAPDVFAPAAIILSIRILAMLVIVRSLLHIHISKWRCFINHVCLYRKVNKRKALLYVLAFALLLAVIIILVASSGTAAEKQCHL